MILYQKRKRNDRKTPRLTYKNRRIDKEKLEPNLIGILDMKSDYYN